MKTISCVLAVLGCIGSAHAQTFTYSFGLPVVQNPLENSITGELSLFDTNLGVLTSAALTLYGGTTHLLSLTNTSASDVTFTATSRAQYSATSSLPQLSNLLEGSSARVVTSYSTGSVALQAFETRLFGPLVTEANTEVDLGSILAFLGRPGGGSFFLNCSSQSDAFVQGGGGDVSLSSIRTGGCGASISYNVAAIPEPETALLLATGLAALLLSRRRTTSRLS